MSHAIGIFNGNSRHAQYRREIEEDIARAERAQYWRNYDRFADALESLKKVDPQGWEAWYDSPAIPDIIPWKDNAKMDEIVNAILRRMDAVLADLGTHVDIVAGDPLEREGWPYHVEGDEELPY